MNRLDGVNGNLALLLITAQIKGRQMLLPPRYRLSNEQVIVLAWKVYMKRSAMPEETRVTTSKVDKIEEVEETVETPDGTNDIVSVVSSKIKEKQKKKPIQDRFTDKEIEVSVRVIVESKEDVVKANAMLEASGVDVETLKRVIEEAKQMNVSNAENAFKKNLKTSNRLSEEILLEMVKENQMDKPVEQRIPDEHFELSRYIYTVYEMNGQNGLLIWLNENTERLNFELLTRIRNEMNALEGTLTYEFRLRAALVRQKKAAEGNYVEPAEPDEQSVLIANVMATMLKEQQKGKEARDRFTDKQIESIIEMYYEKEKDKENGMLFWAAKQKNLDMQMTNKLIDEANALEYTKAFQLRVIETLRMAQDESSIVDTPTDLTDKNVMENLMSLLKDHQKRKPVKNRFTDVQIEKLGKFLSEAAKDRSKASKMVETKGWNRLDWDTIIKLKEELAVLRDNSQKACKEGKLKLKDLEEEMMAFETMLRQEKEKEDEARQLKKKMGGEGNVCSANPTASEVATAKNKKVNKKNKKKKKTNNKATSEVVKPSEAGATEIEKEEEKKSNCIGVSEDVKDLEKQENEKEKEKTTSEVVEAVQNSIPISIPKVEVEAEVKAAEDVKSSEAKSSEDVETCEAKPAADTKVSKNVKTSEAPQILKKPSKAEPSESVKPSEAAKGPAPSPTSVKPAHPNENFILVTTVLTAMLKENQKRKRERDRFTDDQIERVIDMFCEMEKDQENGIMVWAARNEDFDLDVVGKITDEIKALKATKAFEIRAAEAHRMAQAGKNSGTTTSMEPNLENLMTMFVAHLKEGQKKKPVKNRFTDVQIDKFGKFFLELAKDREKAMKMVETKGWNRLDQDTILKLKEEVAVLRDAAEAEMIAREELKNGEKEKEEEVRQLKEKMGGEGNGLPPAVSEAVTVKNEKKNKKNKKTNNKTTSEVVESSENEATEIEKEEEKKSNCIGVSEDVKVLEKQENEKEKEKTTSKVVETIPVSIPEVEVETKVEAAEDVKTSKADAPEILSKSSEDVKISEVEPITNPILKVEAEGEALPQNPAQPPSDTEAEMWMKKEKGKTECDDVESLEEEGEEQEEKVEKKRKKRADDGITKEERTMATLEAKMNRMMEQSLAPLRNPLFIIIMFFSLVYSAIGLYNYCEWLVHRIW